MIKERGIRSPYLEALVLAVMLAAFLPGFGCESLSESIEIEGG